MNQSGIYTSKKENVLKNAVVMLGRSVTDKVSDLRNVTRRVPLEKQHDEKDCGVACLSMILGYFGRKIPFAVLREEIKVDNQGANLYGLIDAAEKNGLVAEALEGSADEYYESIADGSVTFPHIARILNHGVYEHYVVVTSVSGGKVRVNDPDLGRRTLTRSEFAECFLGHVVIFSKAPTFRKENLRKGSVSRFLSMITRQKGLIAVIGLLSLLVTGIGLAGSFIFQFLLDNVLSDIDDVCCAEEGLEVFAVVIAACALLYAFKFLFDLLRGKLLIIMSKNIDLPLMLGCYDHAVDLPMSFFDTHKTGEIISRFTDAGKIRDALSSTTLTVMIDTVMVFVGAILLNNISHDLFHIALAIFISYVLISVLYIKPLDKFNNRMMIQGAEYQSYLKESIDGMETVKLTGSEDAVKAKTSKLFRDYIDLNAKGSMMTIKKESIIALITSVGTLALLWAGTLQIINGLMTVGELIVFNSLLGYFLSPVQNLVNLQSGIQTAIVAGKRLNDMMDLSTENVQSAETEKESIDSVEFSDVSFRYGNRDLVLKDMCFSAERGVRLALVGGSGCGKSTITKLLMGMYMPESGGVLINGKPTYGHSLEWLRKHIAIVTQSTFLFADTVRNNLLLGLSDEERPDDNALEALLDSCGCQFIKDLPFGLDTYLEENGANLSGGQRQRLAIVRAILRKPDVLILDEATSNLDALSEHEVQTALASCCPNSIVIAAAHRLSTISGFDRILVLDDGRITEQGTHEELLALDALYAKMWRTQNPSE